MKLLLKSQIIKLKSSEKQKEIEEGLKLAKRVDSLREIQAREDKVLKDFRTNTLSEISKETLKESKKLDSLKSEVKDLEERREKALKPLDEELIKLSDRKKEIEEFERIINNRGREVANEKLDLSKRDLELVNKERAVETLNKGAKELFLTADSSNEQAKAKLDESVRVFNKATIDSNGIINKAMEKEKLLEAREKRIFDKEEELRTKEIDLAKQFSVLRDREETLKRNLKRK